MVTLIDGKLIWSLVVLLRMTVAECLCPVAGLMVAEAYITHLAAALKMSAASNLDGCAMQQPVGEAWVGLVMGL